MWQSSSLSSFRIFFFLPKKKKKKKSQSKRWHIGKGGKELCFGMTIYHISNIYIYIYIAFLYEKMLHIDHKTTLHYIYISLIFGTSHWFTSQAQNCRGICDVLLFYAQKSCPSNGTDQEVFPREASRVGPSPVLMVQVQKVITNASSKPILS